MFTRKGFTLIELLVVVLIIGILAAVALPIYTKSVAKAKAAEAISMIKPLEEAYKRYYLATGTLPNGSNIADVLDISPPPAFENYNLSLYSTAFILTSKQGSYSTPSGSYSSYVPSFSILFNANGTVRDRFCLGDQGMCESLGMCTTTQGYFCAGTCRW